MIFGIIIGLLLGCLGAIIIHNYDLNKCQVLSESTNQDYYDYELQSECYFVLEKTGWHLFWGMIALGFVGMIFFGFIGFWIGEW